MARFRFVVGGAIIAAGIGFLVVTAFHQSATRRTTLAELVAAPALRASSLERLQLGGGTVAPGSILWDEFRSRPEFTIRDGQHALRVRYVGHGVLPDTFRDSAQVVLEGRYDAGGHAEPNIVYG